MNWREAFLVQARSDAEIWKLLQAEKSEYCHQLHYLQMMTEKFAKSVLTPDSATNPPAMSHAAFVNCLRVIKGRPEIRRMLGYKDTKSFSRYIDSLLPIAARIESLAPSIAGTSQPNPEYPWRTQTGDEVIVPCQHDFQDLGPQSVQLNKLLLLVERLLKIDWAF